MACVCNWYNMRYDWLILGHYCPACSQLRACFLCALLLMQFSACTRISKIKHVINRAIILASYSTPALFLFFFFMTEHSVLMALVFYLKDVLEKVTMQRTQQFSAFALLWKNPVKCSACTVARKIETNCFCGNLISNDPVVRISRNLAKK